MSKSKVKNDNELSIFEKDLGVLQEFEYDLKEAISKSVRKYIRQSPKRSRHSLAGKISHLLNRSISKDMLDAYCSTGKSDNHPHADFVAAVCQITKDKKALEVYGEYLKYSILDDDQMIYVDLVRTERRITKLQKKKKELERKLENGNGRS